MKSERPAKERQAGSALADQTRKLAEVIQGPAQQQQEAAAPVTIRQGVIVTRSPDPLTITLGGNPTPVPAKRIVFYSPFIGESVMVLQYDGDLIVLGAVTSP